MGAISADDVHAKLASIRSLAAQLTVRDGLAHVCQFVGSGGLISVAEWLRAAFCYDGTELQHQVLQELLQLLMDTPFTFEQINDKGSELPCLVRDIKQRGEVARELAGKLLASWTRLYLKNSGNAQGRAELSKMWSRREQPVESSPNEPLTSGSSSSSRVGSRVASTQPWKRLEPRKPNVPRFGPLTMRDPVAPHKLESLTHASPTLRGTRVATPQPWARHPSWTIADDAGAELQQGKEKIRCDEPWCSPKEREVTDIVREIEAMGELLESKTIESL